MNDQIQPEPSRPPNYKPTTSSDEPLVRDLRSRVAVLEREKRRWKLIGIGAPLVALLFVFVSGGGLAVATSAFYARRAALERERAEMEAQSARVAAEQQRQAAEKAFQEARRVAEELKKAD